MTPKEAKARHEATHYLTMKDGVTPQMYYKRQTTKFSDGTTFEHWVYLTFADLWHGSAITEEQASKLIEITD